MPPLNKFAPCERFAPTFEDVVDAAASAGERVEETASVATLGDVAFATAVATEPETELTALRGGPWGGGGGGGRF